MLSGAAQRLEHLATAGCSVIVDLSTGIPVIVHWGASWMPETIPSGIFSAAHPFGSLDVIPRVSLLPLHGEGGSARPGLQGHRRGGRHWSPRFEYLDHIVESTEDHGFVLTARAADRRAELVVTSRLEVNADGVLIGRVIVTNDGDSPYMVDALSLTLPLPDEASQLGVYGGRWAREFDVQWSAWPQGAWTSENRGGRTSHEHPPYLWARTLHSGEWQGSVWGVHLAWSGNHVLLADTTNDGQRYVQAGELFHPGEMCLDPGKSLSTPSVIGVYSNRGLTPASWGLHRLARRWSPRPDQGPRPVHINTWEAVYFDHDSDRLRQLADMAARVGVERFVLDDGWFGGRRNDRAGLGDWHVSPEMYPDGLEPLIDHVTARGMEFGIWIEPEMVNPDSDLFRKHPEWILATDGYEPVLGRHQLVLDLTNDEAWHHIVDQIDALLGRHRISSVKWDMNRPHVQASNAQGKAATHAQTLALYALIDTLRVRHPHVEFESCASGGGRIDHAILQRVERVWTSDCNDALERQFIQRGVSMLIPPELMGSHIGPPRAHTTGRRHSLAFRGVTALFGHLGVEWNLGAADERELEQLAHIIDLYKRYRYLLHHGDTVRFDLFETTAGTALAYGVYTADRRQALVAFVQLRTAQYLNPPPLRLVDLDPERLYTIAHVPLVPPPVNERLGPAVRQPGWLTEESAKDAPQPWSMSGAALAAVGLPMPILWPESAVLVHLSSS